MEIVLNDCKREMKWMKEDSIDSIVCDPPYELGFMGKKWDASGIAYDVEVWKEALRVLKPGGHLLAFGGTRTHHRMMIAIEDAGFEIRDCLMWMYGTGFPKSHNISKAIDKTGGKNLSWFIDYILDVAKERGIKRSELTMLFPSKNGKPTGWLYNKKHTQGITLEQYNTLKDFLNLPFETLEEAERKIIGKKTAGLGSGKTYAFTDSNTDAVKEIDITMGATLEAKKWDGWGTALKPAYEPIVFARKPLSEKTIANNVLKHGTGGINIDDCRIGNEKLNYVSTFKRIIAKNRRDGYRPPITSGKGAGEIERNVIGRFPANFILECICDEVIEGENLGVVINNKNSKSANDTIYKLGISKGEQVAPRAYKDIGNRHTNPDCPCKILDEQAPQVSNAYKGVRKKETTGGTGHTLTREHQIGESAGVFDGLAGASRFFYCAKTSKKERNAGIEDNTHPTVKPIKLMEYLVKLITPPNGTVLDPFMGSGSTGCACVNLGFDFYGIEIDEESYTIAKSRIQHHEAVRV